MESMNPFLKLSPAAFPSEAPHRPTQSSWAWSLPQWPLKALRVKKGVVFLLMHTISSRGTQPYSVLFLFCLTEIVKADGTKFFNSYRQQNTLFNSE